LISSHKNSYTQLS